MNQIAQYGGDGSSWARAYQSLELALESVDSSSDNSIEIWIASGDYISSSEVGSPFPDLLSPLKISLHGGFEGNESEMGERSEQTPPTRLINYLQNAGFQPSFSPYIDTLSRLEFVDSRFSDSIFTLTVSSSDHGTVQLKNIEKHVSVLTDSWGALFGANLQAVTFQCPPVFANPYGMGEYWRIELYGAPGSTFGAGEDVWFSEDHLGSDRLVRAIYEDSITRLGEVYMNFSTHSAALFANFSRSESALSHSYGSLLSSVSFFELVTGLEGVFEPAKCDPRSEQYDPEYPSTFEAELDKMGGSAALVYANLLGPSVAQVKTAAQAWQMAKQRYEEDPATLDLDKVTADLNQIIAERDAYQIAADEWVSSGAAGVAPDVFFWGERNVIRETAYGYTLGRESGPSHASLGFELIPDAGFKLSVIDGLNEADVLGSGVSPVLPEISDLKVLVDQNRQIFVNFVPDMRDSDSDGITDVIERKFGGDPFNPDDVEEVLSYMLGDRYLDEAFNDGVNHVKAFPLHYNLVSESEYQAFGDWREAVGRNSVLNDPMAYNLFSEAMIEDLRFDGVMFQLNEETGRFEFSYSIQHSEDLTHWVDYQTEEIEFEASSEKAFLRIRLEAP